MPAANVVLLFEHTSCTILSYLQIFSSFLDPRNLEFNSVLEKQTVDTSFHPDVHVTFCLDDSCTRSRYYFVYKKKQQSPNHCNTRKKCARLSLCVH